MFDQLPFDRDDKISRLQMDNRSARSRDGFADWTAVSPDSTDSPSHPFAHRRGQLSTGQALSSRPSSVFQPASRHMPAGRVPTIDRSAAPSSFDPLPPHDSLLAGNRLSRPGLASLAPATADLSPISPATTHQAQPPSRSYLSAYSSTSDSLSADRLGTRKTSQATATDGQSYLAAEPDYKSSYSVRRELQDIRDRIDKLGIKSHHQTSVSVAAMPTGPIHDFHHRQRSTSVAPSAFAAGLSSPRRQYRSPYLSTSPDRPGGRPMVLPTRTTGQYPLLHDALTRAKAALQPSLYRALETMAADALDLAALTGDGSTPHSSGMSVYTSAVTTPDRQIRRKAENLCRSVTELAIAMCDLSSFPPDSINQAIPTNTETDPPARPAVENAASTNAGPDPSRLPVSRALDRIEARRSSLYQSPVAVATPSTSHFGSRPASMALPSNLASPTSEALSPSMGTADLRISTSILGSSQYRRLKQADSPSGGSPGYGSPVVSSRAGTEVGGPTSSGRLASLSSQQGRPRYGAVGNRSGTAADSAGSSPMPASHSAGPGGYEGIKSPPSVIASLKVRSRMPSGLSKRPMSLSVVGGDSGGYGTGRSYGSGPDTSGVKSNPARHSVAGVPSSTVGTSPLSSRPSHHYVSSSTGADSRPGRTGMAGRSIGPPSTLVGLHQSANHRAGTMSSSSGSSSPPASSAVASAATADTGRSIMATPPRASKPVGRLGGLGSPTSTFSGHARAQMDGSIDGAVHRWPSSGGSMLRTRAEPVSRHAGVNEMSKPGRFRY